MIRPAALADVPRMVELSERTRSQLATYLPTFWRKAENSAAAQTVYFNDLIEQGEAILRVHETDSGIDGFIIALLINAPPVYDPGGLTCLIDDFCVAHDEDWLTVGRELLDAAITAAREHGAVQVAVICPDRYDAKRELLAAEGLVIGSSWHIGDL